MKERFELAASPALKEGSAHDLTVRIDNLPASFGPEDLDTEFGAPGVIKSGKFIPQDPGRQSAIILVKDPESAAALVETWNGEELPGYTLAAPLKVYFV